MRAAIGLRLARAGDVSNELFFEGDPETDSTRRHMERVLSAPRPRTLQKAALAGVAAWGIWRLLRALTPLKRRDVAGPPNRR
jgi:hypothetical protein